jgi:hypothetical protein
MRTVAFPAIVLGLCCHAIAAEEKFDPTARAKAVAPYIDEETFAILHADVTRVSLVPLFQLAADLVPEAKKEVLLSQTVAAATQSALMMAGARDIYVVVSTADISFTNHKPPPLIFTLGNIASDKALATLLKPLGYEIAERMGDVFLAASGTQQRRLKSMKPDPRPDLAAAFEAAGDTAAQAILIPPSYWRRVIEEMLPTLPKVVGGGPSSVLTRGVRWAAMGADTQPKLSLRAVIQSQDREAATALGAKWSDLTRVIADEEEIKRNVPKIDDIIRLLTPEVQNDRLVLHLDSSKRIPALIDLLKPALEKARAEARRATIMNNLRQIGMAMHVYESQHNSFPPAAIRDAKGTALLSWRVAILPYLGQDALYKDFHLDEPWNSQHNRKLIERVPAVYRSPTSKLTEKGRTNYLVPAGKDTLFPPGGTGVKFQEIKDACAQTIVALEVDDDQAVVWTRPEDLPFDPEKPAKGLGKLEEGGFLALFADGHVQRISSKVDAKTLRALVTPAGGELVDPGAY